VEGSFSRRAGEFSAEGSLLTADMLLATSTFRFSEQKLVVKTNSVATKVNYLSRREMLCRLGGGFGALALSSVFADAGFAATASTAPVYNLDPKQPHFTPRAKRVIFLFMNGGPSQMDTFDPKPALAKCAGQIPEVMSGDKKKAGKGIMP